MSRKRLQARELRTLQELIDKRLASRIAQKDATLYDFTDDAFWHAQHFMGWTDLASNPPYEPQALMDFAQEVHQDGIEQVVLIGEGGSSQAPLTIARIFEHFSHTLPLTILDSLSPLYVQSHMKDIDIAKAIVIISSKSGTTLETRSLARVIWDYAKSVLGEAEAAKHFVVITDPGSRMQKLAEDLNFRAVFLGQANVGGRFSALSVFGLVPAALIGVDLVSFVNRAKKAEERYAQDSHDNEALKLAAFLHSYANISVGFTFSIFGPKPVRSFGLWIEQMVAESLGKHGKGIVPHIEVDPALLREPQAHRPVIVYDIAHEEPAKLSALSDNFPFMHFEITEANDIADYFLQWEFATSALGYLIKINPFSQPNVAEAKTNSSRALHGLLPSSAKVLDEGWLIGEASNYFFDTQASSGHELLKNLFASAEKGDWLSINAFLPFFGVRREPLERMRHEISEVLKIPVSLQIGPRFLHSTGQLHKGGPNNGLFITLSAGEDDDFLVPGESHSLSDIMIAQSKGDLYTLSERGRRAVHLHLSNNHPDTLDCLAHIVAEALKEA
ncbi:MAG: glucose-6-phosphate isomerase [Coriobacteriia bacterium]|nr:glucose-6-phosphate isomerase [Coriobacteriia bacterium]